MRHRVFDRRVPVQYGGGEVFKGAAYQRGHGIYMGSAYQKGHGLGKIFGGLFRAVMPLFMDGAKAVGKQALHTGLDILSDASKGRNLKESAAERLEEGFKSIGGKIRRRVEQSGGNYKSKDINPKPSKRAKVIKRDDCFTKGFLKNGTLT
jgi:hypothetical protein